MIFLKRGDLTKLTAALKVSKPTVINALKYRSHTPLAVKIRSVAIKEYNGIVLRKDNK